MNASSVEKIIIDFFTHSGLLLPEDIVLKNEKDLFFSLHTKDARLLLGRDGENLQSINYLLKRIIEKSYNEETAKAFTLDINDFHKKKIDQLKTTAHMLAERARFFKSSVDLDPMNPYERRIVHEYLQSYTDVTTESVGQGKDRHIVIRFVDKKKDDLATL